MNMLNEFTKIENWCEENKKYILTKHAQQSKLLKEFLGLQGQINEKLVKHVELQSYEERIQHPIPMAIHFLFTENFHSILTAFIELQHYLIHPLYRNCRSVYESIPKMFYISLYPNELHYILIHEDIVNYSFKQVNEYLKEERTKNILQGDLPPFFTKKEFMEFQKKYTPNYFRKNIYTIKHAKLIQHIYSKFSSSSHSAILQPSTPHQYDKKIINDCFDILNSISYYNIVACFNGYSNFFNIIGNVSKNIQTLNDLGKKLQSTPIDFNLYPNKENLVDRLNTNFPKKS